MARLTLRLDFEPGRAIGHGKIRLLEAVLGRAAQVFDVAGVEPFSQVARDVAGTVVGQEPRSIGRPGLVQATGL